MIHNFNGVNLLCKRHLSELSDVEFDLRQRMGIQLASL